MISKIQKGILFVEKNIQVELCMFLTVKRNKNDEMKDSIFFCSFRIFAMSFAFGEHELLFRIIQVLVLAFVILKQVNRLVVFVIFLAN